MQITLKSLKIAKSLSEETTAYTAIVLVDGRPAFHASNHGHGGCDMYHPVQGYTGPTEAEINAYLAANEPPMTFDDIGHPEMTPSPCDLEMFVGRLIEQQERRQILDRLLKRAVVVIGDNKGHPALFSYKAKPTPENLNLLRSKNKPDQTIVNGDAAAYERALALV